jgi:hypothetical protein
MGTTSFQHPELIADAGSEGWIHTQLKITIAPDLNDRFKAKFGADMDFFAFQYYNAAQVFFQSMGKVIDEKKPLTGENVRAALFEIGTFTTTPIPTKFVNNQNTATSEYNINLITKGKDTVLESVPIAK